MKRAMKCLALMALVGSAVGNAFSSETAATLQERDEKEKKVHKVVIRSGLGMGGGFLGVQLVSLTPELRQHFGVSEDRGVMVAKVEEGSPAEGGGIRVGDILTVVDGEDVTSGRALSSMVRKKKKGDTVSIELMRDGRLEVATVTLDEREGYFSYGPGNYSFIGPQGGPVVVPDLDFTMEWNEESRHAFEEAMSELRERMQSGEWREKLRSIESLNLGEIQERMREVEQRLKELEGELAKAEREKR